MLCHERVQKEALFFFYKYKRQKLSYELNNDVIKMLSNVICPIFLEKH